MEKVFAISDATNVITSIVGIVAFFLGAYWLVYICAALSVIHSLLNIRYGGQNNLGSEITALIIAAIVVLVAHLPGPPVMCVSLCMLDVLLGIISHVMLVIAVWPSKRE